MTCGNKRWHKPLVELVHSFQVHVVRQPHVLIHQVEGGMSDELVQMTMVVLDERERRQVNVSVPHQESQHCIL